MIQIHSFIYKYIYICIYIYIYIYIYTCTNYHKCPSHTRGRRQRVMINGTGSSWSPVLSGVPQGTMIGLILFLLYIDDIATGINSRMRLFADDGIIYHEIQDNNDHTLLHEDVSKLQSWSECWQMTFKPEKCFVLTITNKHSPSQFGYHINNVRLEKKTPGNISASS